MCEILSRPLNLQVCSPAFLLPSTTIGQDPLLSRIHECTHPRAYLLFDQSLKSFSVILLASGSVARKNGPDPDLALAMLKTYPTYPALQGRRRKSMAMVHMQCVHTVFCRQQANGVRNET